MDVNVKHELLKFAPPATVTGTALFGISLQDWVYVATIIYTGVQCYVALRKVMKGGNKRE